MHWVVEGLLHHFVQGGEEFLLLNAVCPDAVLDAHLLLEGMHRGNQAIQLLLVILALQAQELGDFRVAAQGVGMVVLGEGAHLSGNLRGVEAQHFLQ